MSDQIIKLLDAVTTTGAGASFRVSGQRHRTFHGNVEGSGAVSATVQIQATHDPNDANAWITIATLSLSGVTNDADGVVVDAAWPYVRGNVTAIAGSGAKLTLRMGL